MEISFSFIPGVQPVLPLTPYEVEEKGNVTYTRYTDGKIQQYRHMNVKHGEPKDSAQLIIRKTIDGAITRMEKAWDLWANRESAKYIPINSVFDGMRTLQ